jgi:hypothetical protein
VKTDTKESCGKPYWGPNGRCIHCGAGNDAHHSYTCPTNMHPDKRESNPPISVNANDTGKAILDPLVLLTAVHDHMEAARILPHPNAPGHSHNIPGRWDADGTPCEWCATWDRVRECVKQNASGDGRKV